MNKKKIFGLILIILCLPIYNIYNVYAAPTERENFHHGDAYDSYFSTTLSTKYLAETFLTPSSASSTHTVTSVKLYVKRMGSVSKDTWASIKATDVNGKPTGADLCISSAVSTSGMTNIAWVTYTMTTEPTLSTSTLYAVCLKCNGDASNAIYWGYDSHGGYADGKCWSSTDSGSTWTEAVGYDLLFQIWGNDAVATMIFTSSPSVGTGYIKVNNVAQTTPYSNLYIVGEVILIEALSPRVITSNVEQKVYTSWSDSGSQTHNYTVLLGGATITANYKTQYKHIVSANPISGTGILNIDDSARTSPYTTGWLDSGGTISLNCTLFPTGHNGNVFDYWNDLLARHHHVAPTTSANYTAYYKEPPFYGNSTINISGNATVTVNTIPHVLPYSFNATSGNEYNITASYTNIIGNSTINISGNSTVTVNTIPHVLPYSFNATENSEYNITAISNFVLSGNVTLNVDGNATITLDSILVVTPDSFDFVSGSIHNITAFSGLSSPSINISNLNFIIGVLIFVPIGLILVLIIGGKRR